MGIDLSLVYMVFQFDATIIPTLVAPAEGHVVPNPLMTPTMLLQCFFCEVYSIYDWLIYISDNVFMLTSEATLNGVLLDHTHERPKTNPMSSVLCRQNMAASMRYD
jgi:hypothetical protein